MFSKKFHFLALSLLALSVNSAMFASSKENDRYYDRGVTPAQANYQDEEELSPIVDLPISFAVKNFKDNIDVNHNRSVFEVKIPGLYSIDAFLLLNVPNVEDVVSGYITINERKLLTFFNSETRTLGPIVEFHFNDRLVYLEKGDKVSVVLSEFTPGTAVLSRGFVMVAYNNSR